MKKILLLWLALLLTLSACTPENPAGESAGADVPSGITSEILANPEETDTVAPSESSDPEPESAAPTTKPEHPSEEPEDTDSEEPSGDSDTPVRPTSSDTASDPQNPDPSVTDTPSPPSSPGGSTEENSPWEDEKADTPLPTPTTGLTPESPSEYYGYNWLKQNAAELTGTYGELTRGIEAMQEKITFSEPVPVSKISLLWYCYWDDHPEHFWVEGGYSYSYLGDRVISVTPTYTMSLQQKQSAEPQLKAAVTELLKGLGGNLTQYDLEKELHDRLVLHCDYQDGTYAHTAYGALVQGTAVCDGYSRAFQLLCRNAGIQSLLVRGTSDNPNTGVPEGHAWNAVLIDGSYYHVDVTWDDAGDADTEEEINYAWFNVTTAQLRQDHDIRSVGYEPPHCTASTHNYYEKTGAKLLSLTVDGLLEHTYKKNGIYHCRVYVVSPGNITDWFNKNLNTLTQRMSLGGYDFSLSATEHEVYYTIIPK